MITTADFGDIPELTTMVNTAYRGEASRKGWTTEADLVDGDLRTDEQSLSQLLRNRNAAILKFVSHDHITGCVYLEKQESALYLGMLSVSPTAQAQGIGKKLLNAAEEYARQRECQNVFMTVISLRYELIEWYERHGYKKNGETKPFPENGRFGKARQPLEFIVLEKKLY